MKIVKLVILIIWSLINIVYGIKVSEDTSAFYSYTEIALYTINLLIYLYFNYKYINTISKKINMIYLLFIIIFMSLWSFYLKIIITDKNISNYDFIGSTILFLTLISIVIYSFYVMFGKNKLICFKHMSLFFIFTRLEHQIGLFFSLKRSISFKF